MEKADSKPGGDTLRETVDHDASVGSGCRQRRVITQKSVDRVFDDEETKLGCELRDLLAPCGGHGMSDRVMQGRLQIESGKCAAPMCFGDSIQRELSWNRRKIELEVDAFVARLAADRV